MIQIHWWWLLVAFYGGLLLGMTIMAALSLSGRISREEEAEEAHQQIAGYTDNRDWMHG